MEELLALMVSDPEKAIGILMAGAKDQKKIEDIQKELYDLDRTFRPTQIDQIQKEKTIKTDAAGGTSTVAPVRIPVSFQSKIVNTATAFEVGGGVNLQANDQNDLSDEIARLLRANRIEAKLQKMKKLQKGELQSALLFYIEDTGSKNIFNRWLNINQSKEIKCRVLENSKGQMAPYFDANGDMTAFTWKFKTKNGDKDIDNAWVYTETQVYKYDTTSGSMALIAENPIQVHGFGKIPIVYTEQDKVEWAEAEPMIDRIEVALSKLGASNDYVAYPMLLLYGKVEGGGNKDDAGKVFKMPMEKDEDGKWQHGDVKFLEHSQAPEASKLELEMLEKYIYSITSTPDISFNNIKGIGQISGLAIKLMFLDAMIKARMNEGENKTIVERIVNVLIAGTVTSVNTGLSEAAKTTYFDVHFETVLPDDIASVIDMLVKATGGPVMSQETGVKSLGKVEDVDAEMALINGSGGAGGEE